MLGSLIAACHAAGSKLSEQRITFLGAGSAGCGIAEAIIAQMVSEGLSDEQARSQVYMVDRWGLLQEGMQNLLDFQKKLVQKHEDTKGWESDDAGFSLLEVVKNAKPTVLIGVSGAPGLFSKEVIQAMHANCKRPIVFPLSNPTSRVEATPNDIIRWTDGASLVATGSPFDPVIHDGKTFEIAQCNNSYIFPGIGLGILAVSASRVTDEMLTESSRALAECSPLAQQGTGALLPPLEEIHRVSKRIAFAVGKKAIEQGVALEITDETLEKAIDQHFWQPVYRRHKRTAF
jgi:malate dehydrogenase (oxaloacetate-decarboxylating)